MARAARKASWGPLAGKYEAERPRRLLALDGGGIRGVLTLEVLLELERQLAAATGEGDAFRLGDFFDYVAGTSTGAIIAAALARGKRVGTILDFYVEHGASMFRKAPLWRRLRALYETAPLESALKEFYAVEESPGVYRDARLFPEDLRCLLLLVTRNVTTDSPWPLSSNPFAKYNDPGRPDCNLDLPLWKLVRASTAAPVYFRPEVLRLGEREFEFQDGGTTPHNNPSFLLYRMATLAQFRLDWPTGESKLALLSVGTGSGPNVQTAVARGGRSVLSNVQSLPGTFMEGSLVDQDVNCRTVGRCVHGHTLDREQYDLVPVEPRADGVLEFDPDADPPRAEVPLAVDLGRHFLYARWNAELTAKGLARLGVGGVDAGEVGRLDAVDRIDELREIGRAVAATVDLEPFRRFWRPSEAAPGGGG